MALPVRLDHYTAPDCAWSWALEPSFRAVLDAERAGLEVHYFLLPAGPDTGTPPAVLAEEWARIGNLTGVPINPAIWRAQPPASTRLAALAVIAARLQGQAAAGRYLKALRPMLLVDGRSPDDRDVLLAAAEQAQLDLGSFELALRSTQNLEARFRQDQESARLEGIASTPALVLRNHVGDRVVIEGLRDRELIARAIAVLRVDDDVDEASGLPINMTPLMQEIDAAAARQENRQGRG